MRSMKRAGALTLAALILALSLTACGKGEGNSSSPAAGTGLADRPGVSTSEDEATGGTKITVDLDAVTDVFLTTAGVSGDTVVAQAGDVDITAAELLYWVAYSADSMLNYYSTYFGITELPWDTEDASGVTLTQGTLDNALRTAALYALIPGVAEGEGVALSQDFQDTFAEQLASMTAAMGGEDVMAMYLWQYPLTPELYTQLCESEDLNGQIQDKYFGENGTMKPTDADLLSYIENDRKLYSAKHILLLTVDPDTMEPLDEAAAAEKKAQAEDLLRQLRESSDPAALFDQLMNEYSEDTGLATNPDGYHAVESGQMVAEFEEASLALEPGEISDIVETDYGYHIIQRIPLEVEPTDYQADFVQEKMTQLQQGWLDENEIVTNEAFDQLDVPAFYETVTALRQAVSTRMEELAAQEDASASAGTSSSSAPAASGSAQN